jgi:excisionase family DNA binding protein
MVERQALTMAKTREVTMKNTEELMTSYDASRIADVSAATIRLWANRGKLTAIRTTGGVRLFKRSEVEAVAQRRKESSTVKR